MKKTILLLFLIIAICLGYSSATFSQSPTTTNQTTTASKEAKPLEQMVPMRDGARLSMVIFLPEGKGPWPVVLVRTPYGKTSRARGNGIWIKQGFAFAVQDCRGTFQSEGRYRPFLDDQLDGYDTVEWIASRGQMVGSACLAPRPWG